MELHFERMIPALTIIIGHRRFLSVIDGRDNRQTYRDQATMADQKPFLNLQHFMDFILAD